MATDAKPRVLRLIGMSRSGNHAVINWILAQLTGRYCFLNCTEPGHNPYASARRLADGRRYLASGPVDLAQAARAPERGLDTLLFSHEDVFLGPVGRDRPEQWLGEAGEWSDVLILRDPYNLFASRFKSGFEHMSPQTALRIWKQHAREALKPRHLRRPLVVIRFNDWVMSRRYRARVAERLRLGFSDRGVDRVADCNGGSSFDGLRYDGQAGSMRVLERWRHYGEDPAYRALFDRQTVELAADVFGDLPAGAELAGLAQAG